MQRDQHPPRATALITGAGSGIGRALALEAAARGMAVLLVGRRLQALEETAALIGTVAPVAIFSGDMTDENDRAALIAFTADKFRHLDFLVNNAGSVASGPFETMTDQQIAAMVSVNLLAPCSLIRQALPLLKRARSGRVINVGSMFGDIAFPRFAAYSATKFALRGLSDGLRRELAADGIGVTYAAPRATKTPAASDFDALVKPMGMVLDPPEKVASAIWAAALKGRSRVFPGPGERLAAMVQAVLPGILDRHLSALEVKLRRASL